MVDVVVWGVARSLGWMLAGFLAYLSCSLSDFLRGRDKLIRLTRPLSRGLLNFDKLTRLLFLLAA